jgi:hypothetical protein
MSVAGKGIEDTLKHAEDIMSRQSMEESYLENGEFLPISVWVTRGFNGDKIQAETEPEERAPRDIKIHKSGRPDR